MTAPTNLHITKNNTWTEEEIRQQPSIWLNAINHLENQRVSVDAFLQPILACDKLKIILTGAGSSAFIGEMIVPWLNRHITKEFISVPTTDIVTNPQDYLPADCHLLLVSFARSGNSPESVAAVDLVNQQVPNSYHLVITCNEAGKLYQNGFKCEKTLTVLLPPETHDRGFAMTSSITTMMAACLAVFSPTHFTLEHFSTIANRCQSVMTAQGNFNQAIFGDHPWKRVIYIGSGALQGVARESALKVLELTGGKIAAFYDSATGFRHGPKSLIDAETLVVQFISNHPYTRRYDIDLLNELRVENEAMKVIALADRHDSDIENGDHLYFPGESEAEDADLAFCFLLYAQIFALQESLKAGLRPDSPSATGTVNRVVKGVIIYPWLD
ncbi:SIS domain-containing protein [Yersinia intermedia]|nr:SIS domain-containing protein [Yersinia intermedia]